MSAKLEQCTIGYLLEAMAALPEGNPGKAMIALDASRILTGAAGLPAYSELLALLKEAQRVGLDLHIGTAYISRAYIDKQAELNARINAATARAGGAA